MEGFLDGLGRALSDQNWHAALVMSLTLPDICVKASDLSKKTNRHKYATWFDENVGHKYTSAWPLAPGEKPHVFLSGYDCYALRCAMLHAGSADITGQEVRRALESFHFCAPGVQDNRWHNVQRDGALLLMVDQFAQDMLEAAHVWWGALDPNRRDLARDTHLTLLDSDRLTSF